jgi:hypothetical protein
MRRSSSRRAKKNGKLPGPPLRVGEKVTVEYTMTATTIEVKAAKAEAKAEKK